MAFPPGLGLAGRRLDRALRWLETDQAGSLGDVHGAMAVGVPPRRALSIHPPARRTVNPRSTVGRWMCYRPNENHAKGPHDVGRDEGHD
jgi:hypothetical protein